MFINEKSTVVAIAGPDRGMKIRESIIRWPAPSIVAASVKSFGIELTNSMRRIR